MIIVAVLVFSREPSLLSSSLSHSQNLHPLSLSLSIPLEFYLTVILTTTDPRHVIHCISIYSPKRRWRNIYIYIYI